MIETERLILRPFVMEDAEDVLEYLCEPAVHCFECMRLHSIDEAKEEVSRRLGETEYYFAITLKENGKVIGEIDAYPEMADPNSSEAPERDVFSPCWMLNKKYQGKGYAYESAYAFFDYLFNQKGARRIYAYTEDYNLSSQRLCQKLGMRREGLYLDFISFVKDVDGSPCYENTMQFAILKKEWELIKKKKASSHNNAVWIEPLTEDDREQFILDNQNAFREGISVDFPQEAMPKEKGEPIEIISRNTIENCIDHGVAYRIKENGVNVGGLVLSFRRKPAHGDLELLFVSPNIHSKGVGYAAWREVERLYPDIAVWETCTPSFEERNIHFYVNKCGFHIVEFFNKKHPDPHDPETGKGETYEGGGGMFRFEKVM